MSAYKPKEQVASDVIFNNLPLGATLNGKPVFEFAHGDEHVRIESVDGVVTKWGENSEESE